MRQKKDCNPLPQTGPFSSPGSTEIFSHHGFRTLTSRSGCPGASPSLCLPFSAAAAALPSPAQSRIDGCLAPLSPGGSSRTCVGGQSRLESAKICQHLVWHLLMSDIEGAYLLPLLARKENIHTARSRKRKRAAGVCQKTDTQTRANNRRGLFEIGNRTQEQSVVCWRKSIHTNKQKRNSHFYVSVLYARDSPLPRRLNAGRQRKTWVCTISKDLLHRTTDKQIYQETAISPRDRQHARVLLSRHEKVRVLNVRKKFKTIAC